jgi:hypothetical protein
MATHAEQLASIASTIADYCEGEIARPDAKHVERWILQFPPEVREPLTAEMAHVLGRTYIPKKSFQGFLKALLTNQKLCGADPASFWRDARFLDIQGGGRSQHEMLAMLDPILQREFGFALKDCGKNPERFVYLDDGLFTGNRILRDLKDWIEKEAPANAVVHVIVMALHTNGQQYASGKLSAAARAVGKKIEFTWWRLIELEDRKNYTDTSDVLRVTRIPDDARTQAYAKALKYPVVFRRPGNVGALKIFSSEGGRDLLEQQLLMAGTYIREKCPHLKVFQRPLGNVILETPGFGSTIVTFRNCPNNTPLAFWAGNPWYPLFSRKTN